MDKLPKHFLLDLKTKANSKAVVQGSNYRFTVLTDRLIRMEYDESGKFEDRPTQMVFNREFSVPDFTVTEKAGKLTIQTEYVTLCYEKGKPFEMSTLWLGLRGDDERYEDRWYFGDNVPRLIHGKTKKNLLGTVRTLDNIDGAVNLGDGLCSRQGFATLDDKASLVITDDGFVAGRDEKIEDTYYFGFGKDFYACIRDFYKLTGAPPMIPKYALGNWWSRYHKYTQQEYMELIERLEREDIPFSVAVLDMDWHLVDLPKGLGRGWTGYTWNEEFFPDYKGFLKWLHAHGLHTSLNLHPADGVRRHEVQYKEMAEAMGVDPKSGDSVDFDPSSIKYWNSYFDILLHPYEKDGIDFWWMDWQQGKVSPLKNLDPLWMLNHYHTLDIQRNGERPLFFSRYSGPGSHRYPVGFSGDTIITWESLDFQPYFTATASNIGYSWWSHDIGGHCRGTRDDELVARWIQFGVFSPINRLHSSRSSFTSREPWNYNRDCEASMKKYLRLRQSLIPYIYTMAYRNYKELIPLIVPMYYDYPNDSRSYLYKNQYKFGDQLMVSPITSKADAVTCMGSTEVWLPDGKWIDFFSGIVYEGGRELKVFRTLDDMPVFAKAGAIVPTAAYIPYDNTISNQTSMQARVFAGADGKFTLYEDDGISNDYRNGKCAVTEMTLDWGKKAVFTIAPSKGELSVLPEKRQWDIILTGFAKDAQATVSISGKAVECETSYDSEAHALTISLPLTDISDTITVTTDAEMFDNEGTIERCHELLLRSQYSYDVKDRLFLVLKSDMSCAQKLATIASFGIDRCLFDALSEILTAL